jgi:hypothetical protein
VGPTGITARNVVGGWHADWAEIKVVGIKNLGGGNRLGDPSLVAAAIENTAEPRGITATLAFGGKPRTQAADLARIRLVAPAATEILPYGADVGLEWYKRRWQRRDATDPRAGYFDR